MYAVIKTGGKQYKVSPGDVLEVEHLKVKGDDAAVRLIPLLVVTDQRETVVSANQLSEFPVSAKVLGDSKGDKVTVFKYRPKSGYASKTGHRQLYSLIQITAIGDTKAAELKTAEDVEPEITGPQKPAPVEKKEPAAESEADASSSAPGDDAPRSENAPAQTASDVTGETPTPEPADNSDAATGSEPASPAPPAGSGEAPERSGPSE